MAAGKQVSRRGWRTTIADGAKIFVLPAFFVCLVGLIAYLQVLRLAAHPDLQQVILTLLLVGVPLTSYHFHREIRRSGRPILAGLMHALALFSAIMALAIADVADPIARGLSLGGEELAGDARPDDPAQGTTKAGNAAGRALPATSKSPSISGPPAPAPAASQTALPDQRTTTYSLYDMLSLVGMIATITLIVFGALVPEETRMLERRRDRRLRILETLNRYATAVTAFHQSSISQSASEGLALNAWHAGNELEILVDGKDEASKVHEIITRLHEVTGIQAAIDRTRASRAIRAAPADLQAGFSSLRDILEQSHPRQT